MFLWCHIRLNNPKNRNAERINKQHTEIASKLNYSGIEFPLKADDYELIENRFHLNVNVFGYDSKVYPIYVSKKFNTQILYLLLIPYENKSHYVFIKDFDKLMY